MRQLLHALFGVAAFIAAFFVGAVLGQVLAHDQYKDWKMPDTGASCCNDHDCGPSRAYIDPTDEMWRAWNPTTREWVVVPPNKVLKGPSPDGRTHWCGVGEVTFCFMPGDTKS